MPGGKDQPASSFVVSMVTRAVFGLLTVGMKSRGSRSPFPICCHLLLTSLKARVAKDALTCQDEDTHENQEDQQVEPEDCMLQGR